MARRVKRRQSRGVVLLVILSLLVLFALLGVTFVIVSSQYKVASGNFMRADTYGDDWARQTDTAIYVVLRDTADPSNPLRFHSLLRDVYGDDTKYGTVQGATFDNTTGNQFINITCATLNPTIPPNLGDLNGCVLTFYRPVGAAPGTNRLSGTSVRVVGYDPNGGTNPIIRVVRPTTDSANDANWLPQANDAFLVNGKAFSGAGAGFDHMSGKLSATIMNEPNRKTKPPTDTTYSEEGVNENWDAPDLQNLYLAAVIPDATHPTGIKHDAGGYPCILPSFHRPALIQFGGGMLTPVNSFRPAGLPPLGATATNPMGDPINGPWDVDNDGDGIADSIWIDLNLPVQTTRDGRRYKPLVAFQIIDMDGKLNLNHHGNKQHYDADPLQGGRLTVGIPTATQTVANTKKGAGIGPAEIKLGQQSAGRPIGLGLTPAQYYALMAGNGTLPGRYGTGADIYPGNYSAVTTDQRAFERFRGRPANYFGGGFSSYNFPDDLDGRFSIAVSAQGMPITDAPQDITTDLRQASPYRTQLSSDKRFTPAELERLLRYYDIDANQLPTRLEMLGGVFSGMNAQAAVHRHMVTVEGRDMPVAMGGRFHHGMMEHVHETIPPGSLSPQQYDQLLMSLLDRDLYFGLRMNLNRPLGDGMDNNNNGVVDEPDDAEITPQLTPNNGYFYQFANGEDTNYNGTQDDQATEREVRARLAKHLYVLATLCTYGGGPLDNGLQRRLAQWAINVVDFRDADSIMTRFNYDPNPIDGDWNETEYVWGCERPELLLTETFAPHDRRTQDKDNEMPIKPGTQTTAGMTTDPVPTKKDEDYDQAYLPQGSLFVELYNPWNVRPDANNVWGLRPPRELYGNQNGVILSMTTPVGNSPVWRMLIVKGGSRGAPDPDLPTAIAAGDKDRCIYFTNPTGVDPAEPAPAKSYYPDTTTQVAPLLPGRYAVIGSGPQQPTGGKYTTILGFIKDPDLTAAPDPTTRQIELTPDPSPAVNQFKFLNNNHSDSTGALQPPNYAAALTIQPTIAVVINQSTAGPARLSISEPVSGYSIPVADGNMIGTVNADNGLTPITPPADEPLDKGDSDLMDDGVQENQRMIFLQRLANPLLPHNNTTNPYLTIDRLGVDINSFNGLEKTTDPGAGGAHKTAFESLQRGTGGTDRNIWRCAPNDNSGPRVFNEPAETDANFNWGYKLYHTLGYLNSTYLGRATADDGTLGLYMGDPALSAAAAYPFPWLAFHNRPFNNIYELTDVPVTPSSRLTIKHRVPLVLNSPYLQNDQSNFEFGHLINYYNTDPTSPGPMGGGRQISDMYRIFEYLRIPSPFVEAEMMLNPQQHTNGTYAQNPFHPPFNWLSNWRDPGMMNINTIYSEAVWNAALGGDPSVDPRLGPVYDKMVTSRRGYSALGGQILDRVATIPTEFAAPFRASGTGKVDTIPEMSPMNDIDMTFMRRDPDPANSGQPLFGNNNVNVYENSARHSFFRHQTMGRMSNIFTTRSNVFACWVTIGYFEVDATGQVGQELNSDTGEIVRHRSFYMIDRSIPVGFQPGENHNVDRAFLVRRHIE